MYGKSCMDGASIICRTEIAEQIKENINKYFEESGYGFEYSFVRGTIMSEFMFDCLSGMCEFFCDAFPDEVFIISSQFYDDECYEDEDGELHCGQLYHNYAFAKGSESQYLDDLIVQIDGEQEHIVIESRIEQENNCNQNRDCTELRDSLKEEAASHENDECPFDWIEM